jgi:acyl-CoA thioester hydrolase
MPPHDDIKKYRFKATTRVRMSQTDIVGIVNNIRFFDFIEIGRFEYFRDMGLRYADMRDYGVSMALLESSCRYLSPLYFDEIIEIHTRVDYIGDSSFKVRYLIYVPERDVVVAEGKTASIFLGLESRKPIKIPDKLRKIMFDYEGEGNIATKDGG